MRPSYLKAITLVSGQPYYLNALSMPALPPYDVSMRRFRSSPLVKWEVLVWRLFKAAHGTNISQQGHRGCGRLPYFSMTTVYYTCRCRDCTCNPVLIANLPLHPLNGHYHGPVSLRKEIRYA